MSSNASAGSTPALSSPAQATTSTDGTSLSSQSSPTSSPISGADNSSTPSPASSVPQSSANTTNNAPTTTTPATQATTTTTSQSSPAQTSATAAVTATSSSSSSSASSTSFTSATVPTTTSSTSFTTQVATTLYSTDPSGSAVYVTTTVPDVITSAVSLNTTSSSSHTGVIVGAVVGGVAGIAILALLLFCIRKRVRKDEFDGNFDPDRIVGHADGAGATLPNVDLADEVTPFPQSYTDQGSSSMRQYGDSPRVAIPLSLPASGKASTEFYPPGAGAAVDAQPRLFMQPGAGPSPSGAYLPPISMYGAGPVDWHTPRPGISPPPSTVSNNTSSTRATKEREALERSGQGLGLTTQQEVPEGSGDVVVHQDAGRAPVEEPAPPREIPPAYDSIRQD